MREAQKHVRMNDDKKNYKKVTRKNCEMCTIHVSSFLHGHAEKESYLMSFPE